MDRERAGDLFPPSDVVELRRRFSEIIEEEDDRGPFRMVWHSAEIPEKLIEMAEEAGVLEEFTLEAFRQDLNERHLSLDPDTKAKVLDVFIRGRKWLK